MAARVQYWDDYVDSLVGLNARDVPLDPVPSVQTPSLRQNAWYNGAISVQDASYDIPGDDPIIEKGLGMLVGFVRPNEVGNPETPDADPNTWLCVYARIIHPKRQKANPYKPGPRPRSKDLRRVQLRAKKLTYHHEELEADTWTTRDNSLVAERDVIPLQWFADLTKAQKITRLGQREEKWDAAANALNRAHMNLLRVHSTTLGGLEPLPA